MSEIKREGSYEAYSFDMRAIYQIELQTFNDDIGIYYFKKNSRGRSRQRLTEGEEYDVLYRYVIDNSRGKIIYGLDRAIKSVLVVKL